jgi:oxygen-independent coproporphyrinogen III oxidase
MNHDTFSLPLRQRQLASAASIVRSPPRGFFPFPVRSLYIHIPFCFHKCHYCDFYSIVDTRDRQEPFIERLVRELNGIAAWAAGQPLQTIFVGGGTPTLLRPELWSRLLVVLGDLFDLSEMGNGPGEFTVECNPETATPQLMAILADGGVNRLSIGAQSFNPAHLKLLERWHDPANVFKALELAAAAGIPRRSLDLIFGIPGQTPEQWGADLAAALSAGVTHLSCYNLTYEPQTALTARLSRGDFVPADEDVEVQMLELTLATLRAAGLQRYEVSNYAKPGDESRHNLAYWRQEQWLAVGPSASAHLAGNRWKNVPRLDDYLHFDDQGLPPITDLETPDPRRALSEWIMTGLRLAEGIDSRILLNRAGQISKPRLDLPARMLRIAHEYEDRGMLTIGQPRWALTDAGFLLADSIAGDFMACIR